MADFLTAYKRGLDAANKAERNRTEIKAVIKELNSQLKDATNDMVGIDIVLKDLPLRGLADIAASSFRPLKYQALCVYNPRKHQSDKVEIAKWEESENGYPCTITINNQRLKCTDKETLEMALEELLADPRTGEAFQTILN
ncbi:hypothetical protein [Alteromonas genovensis]|uniref:hypothetical protein n=1 Tax=Alteromonas genovensis TaxID=471225 RepID=UPI002FE09474